jgi:hypothetical protein
VRPEEFNSPNFRYREWYQGCKGKADECELSQFEASGKWDAEPKRDGIWVAAFFNTAGNEFYSRTCERKPYSLDGLPVPSLSGTLLVGELGFGSQESIKRRAELGFDFMDVFDILVHKYVPVNDLNGEDRRELLHKIWSEIHMPQNFILCPRWTMGFAAHYAQQPEGLILKPRVGFPYIGSGEKVKHWIKAKKDHTVDMVIMGYDLSDADTKLGKNMAEHLICGAYVDGVLTPLTKTGGMTHEFQLDVVRNWQEFKGRVVELKHFGQFKSGALRHPSVVRLRDDKRAADCEFDPNKLSHKYFKSI